MEKWIFYKVLYFFTLFILVSCNNGQKNKTGVSNSDEKPEKKEVKETPTPDTSLKSINQKIRNDLNNPALYRKRALIYAGQQDYQAAMADMERAIQLAPDSGVYYLTKADFLFKLNQFDQAYKVAEECVSKNPESAECYLKLSQYNLFFQKYEKSIEYADKALRIDIYNPNAYFIKGINFLEVGDTSAAISSLQTAVEQDQNFLRAYLQLGLIHYKENHPLTEEYYKNAFRIDSTNMEAHYNLGMYYQRNEMYNKALKVYTKMTKINPDYRESYFNMGFIHLHDLKVYNVAAQYFTEAIEVSPKYAEAYYNRGYSYELMGDIMKARKDYKKALEIKPQYDNAAKGLSRVEKKY